MDLARPGGGESSWCRPQVRQLPQSISTLQAGVRVRYLLNLFVGTQPRELIVLSPWIFQYSRILFLHLDQLFDPT